MIQITIRARVPTDIQFEQLLQLITLFDRTTEDCYFNVVAIDGDSSVENVKAMLERLGFPFVIAERPH